MGLLAQIEAFFLTFIVGMLAGLIFHYYQTTIRSLRVGRILLYLMDFILWIIMIFIIAAALLLINQDEMRVYVFLALISGGAVYYASLAQRLQPPVYFLGKSTAYALRKIYNWTVGPMIGVMAWVKKQYRLRQKPPPEDPVE